VAEQAYNNLPLEQSYIPSRRLICTARVDHMLVSAMDSASLVGTTNKIMRQ
jgi:hypothetical protein